MKKELLLLFLALFCIGGLFAQRKTVTGTIVDSTGVPIEGVVVSTSDSRHNILSDSIGHFKIDVANTGAMISFARIGYATQTIAVGEKNVIDVQLKASPHNTLDDIVVVGYGSAKRTDLTGSIATVNMANTLDKPVTSLTNALQGAVPGVTIIARPGDVGGDVGSLNLRGRGNLGTSSPLYVIDGVPVTAGDFAVLKPSDVKSISILKDAASAAIYGSRAAYGVILVTTKTGNAGNATPVVSFNTYYGIQKAIYLPEYAGSVQYAQLFNEALNNAGKASIYTDAQMAKMRDGSSPDSFPNNNWYKLAYNSTAPQYAADLNISGGGQTRYFLSGGVMKQNSLNPNNGLVRYSFRSNTYSKVSNTFTVTSNLSFTRDEIRNHGGTMSTLNINRMLPLTVNKQSDGEWGSITAGQVNTNYAFNNPIRQRDDGGWSNSLTNRFLGTVGGIYKPIKGLEFNGSFSYNSFSRSSATFLNQLDPILNFVSKAPLAGTSQASSLTNTWSNSSNILAQIYGSYEKNINRNFLKLMVGTSFEKYRIDTLIAYRDSFPSNSLSVLDGGAFNGDMSNNGRAYQRVFKSYFGRFNYSFADRYLFEANMRLDASSQFAPGHQWGAFPSFAAGWKISDEAFMQNVTFVNLLKLRASWGKLGNVSNVGYYDFYDALATGTTGVLNGNLANGVYPYQQPNPELSWEKVTMTNIGLDANLFSNRLSIQIDAYNKVTKGILLQVPLPLEYGYQVTPSTNAGIVGNKGIEINVSYSDHIGDLRYTIFGNMTKIKNRIKDLKGQDNQITGDYYINKVGGSVGDFYMYKAMGLFKDSAEILAAPKQPTKVRPGFIRYADVSGPNGKPDGVIDANDRTTVGNDVPYFTYALGLNLDYKNFDLAVSGQGVGGVKVYLNYEASQAFFNAAGIPSYAANNHWTVQNPNPSAYYPVMLTTADNPQANVNSSFWLFNASYFRIKNMTLGYTLPASASQRLHISKLRFYVSSNNLFTIRADKRLKFDPEAPTGRGNFYPSIRTISFGLNLNF